MRYRDYLRKELGHEDRERIHLPSGYHVIGHVILLHLDSSATPYAKEIAEATLRYEKRARTVLIRSGPTQGQQREPNYRYIAGDPVTETIHVEAGVRYLIDPMHLTFSGGNRAERIRLPRLVNKSETVVDMFACVGQFSIPVAKRSGANVIAIEINPRAHKYLVENIRINQVTDRVKPLLADCQLVEINNIADRVIMGYLHHTDEYLPFALKFLKQRGGIIHLHQGWPDSRDIKDLFARVTEACREFDFECDCTTRQIKRYAPGVHHIVVDIHVRS
ncbi:MAG: class I SAM-dependent methyltransferase family protein [Candidatus Thorarchaeota archaeon]|nr:class I SAM-dependent methyltransferase family protein [Candidatus Thorarchaeota archaeon]